MIAICCATYVDVLVASALVMVVSPGSAIHLNSNAQCPLPVPLPNHLQLRHVCGRPGCLLSRQPRVRQGPGGQGAV